MIKTSAHLQAICCCISMLLLSVAFNATSSYPTPASIAQPVKNTFDESSSRGKCQFELSDPSLSLEAESFTYQHQGCHQSEYNIRVPGSLFILLNFTDIHSLTDMPVELGLQRQQQHEQAATPTTATTTENAYFRAFSTGKQENYTFTTPRGTKEDFNATNYLTEPVSHQHSAVNITADVPSGSVQDTEKTHSTSETLKTSRAFNDQDISPLQTLQDTTRADFSNFQYSESGVDERGSFCSLKLIIEVANASHSTEPQVICWKKSWQSRIPLVYRYSVPIKITYIWETHSHSGFSLQFSFLQSKDVDCQFRCNNHLCLLKDQLCDGFDDCPDRSDEVNGCPQEKTDGDNGHSHMNILVVISVILFCILLVVIILMISRRNGARRGRDSLLHPPHSQSSEVFRSTSNSMQDSGQYEALVQDRAQRQSSVAAANPHGSESHRLLQPPQGIEQQQPTHHHPKHPQRICQTNMAKEGVLSVDDSRMGKSWRIPPHQQQHHNLQVHQPRYHNKPAYKETSPDEFYPPHIPVSADGEEGYASEQKSLHSKQQFLRNLQEESGVFRPPPNRTIFDRDSPPPPYSLNPPGTKSLDSLVPPVGVVSVLRPARGSLTPQSSPTGVPRSHSLSCHH
ncbi:unnamed protein product [Lymnaea stagnalis]|uniref:Uncharacterized protein n=1 Tax=Lymnaea stagnalis TaxID=6523 RepID=A0AAV2HJP8_LYMST